jgi:hypothetical protein
LTGKPEEKRALERLEGNIRMYLREIEWKGADWMHQGWNINQWQAPVNMVMYLQVP